MNSNPRQYGRATAEGVLGGYGASALMAVLLGLIAKKKPGAISKEMFSGAVGAGAGAGVAAGAVHGWQSAKIPAMEKLRLASELMTR